MVYNRQFTSPFPELYSRQNFYGSHYPSEHQNIYQTERVGGKM